MNGKLTVHDFYSIFIQLPPLGGVPPPPPWVVHPPDPRGAPRGGGKDHPGGVGWVLRLVRACSPKATRTDGGSFA